MTDTLSIQCALLAEILKQAHQFPSYHLVNVIRSLNISPSWSDILLPPGIDYRRYSYSCLLDQVPLPQQISRRLSVTSSLAFAHCALSRSDSQSMSRCFPQHVSAGPATTTSSGIMGSTTRSSRRSTFSFNSGSGSGRGSNPSPRGQCPAKKATPAVRENYPYSTCHPAQTTSQCGTVQQ